MLWIPVGWVAMGAAVVGVGGYAWRLGSQRPPSLRRALRIASKTGDIDPIGAAISPMPAGRQRNALNSAITQLWEKWERETAIKLIREVAVHIPEEMIIQFWLKRAMEVEPVLASMYFSDTFLQAYYRPDIACRSGHACGCR